MNEQAIQDSYNLFVQQGYKKSIDDFKQLIATNPDALNDSFSLFQKEGYNKSIEDYKNLMGVGAQPTLKKKEPTTTALPLAGTSSGLSSEQNLNPFAKNTVGIPQPAKTVAVEETIKPMAEATSVPAIDITEKAPMAPAIDVKTQKLINDEKNISKAPEEDDWYIDELKPISFLADKIQYLNPSAAALFPTTKGVVKLFDNTIRAAAQGQKAGSVVAPTVTMDALGASTSSETIQKFIKFSKAVDKFGPSKEMKSFSKTYEEGGKNVYSFIKALAENPNAVPEVIVSSASMMANAPTLAAGGAVVGGAALAGGTIVPGVGAIPAALASLPYAYGTMSAFTENANTFAELLKEELDKKKLPFTEEGIRKVLEDKEALSSIRIRSASRGAIIGTVDALTSGLAGKVGAKILGNTAASKVKAGLAGTAIEAVGGSGGEALARAAIGQELDVAEIGLEGIAEMPMAIPSIYTEVLKKPTFKINGEVVTEETVKDIVDNADGAELANIKFDIKNDNVGYNKIIQDKVVTHSIKEEVRTANPDLNETSLNAITELEKQLQTIEGNKTQTGKDKAAALRQEIKNIQENQLQEEVKAEVVKDETIKPKEDAIQKQSTDESLLRGEQPEVGLPKMGEGNVQPEGTTTGTTEVAPAQPKEEVTTEVSSKTPEQKVTEVDNKKVGKNIMEDIDKQLSDKENKLLEKQNSDIEKSKNDITAIENGDQEVINEYVKKSKYKLITDEVIARNPRSTEFFKKNKGKYYYSTGASVQVKTAEQIALNSATKKANSKATGSKVGLNEYVDVINSINRFSRGEITAQEAKSIIEKSGLKIPKALEDLVSSKTPEQEVTELESLFGEQMKEFAPVAEEGQAPYQSKLSADKTARNMGMDDKGFFPKGDPASIKKAMAPYGYGVKTASNGNYYLTGPNGRFTMPSKTAPAQTQTATTTETPTATTTETPTATGPATQLSMVFEPADGLPFKSEVEGNYPIEDKNVKEDSVRTLEEIWSEVKDIKFSGDTKIKNHSDVAFIMKTLESKGVEHAFAVHIDENGNAHIQFLGIGGVSAAVVDARIVTTGAKRYKAKKTYLIHNHPSGNLKPSNADFRLTERIQEGFKGLGIELEHIVIDTYKEQYTVLKQGDTYESFQRAKETTGKEKPYKVEKMDSNKVLSKPIGRVFEAKDVVEKIQQMRFSALPKKGIIVLNSANDIIANIMVDNFEYKTIVDAMIDTPTAVSIIAYGNSDTAIERATIKDLRNELPLLEVRLLDFIQTSSNTEGIIDYYKSWESEGFLGEVQSKYGTNSVMESTVNDNSVTKIVKQARAQGFSEAAIKTFLNKNGFSEAQITDAMATETPTSARVKISEQLTEGFDRMMGEVEGIVEKSKKRNVSEDKIAENVINYVMGSKVYENATDVQREKIIRDIKTKFGIRLKSAPSVAKLFGTIKDIKKFTLTEKQLYIKRLKDLQEGAKTAVAAWKEAAVLMSQEIKGLVKSGNITVKQADFILRKFAKVNMLSPTSVSRFVDYMGKVFADAEYGAQLGTAKGLRADIKKLAKNKDKNADFRKLAQEFINIDPSMVDDIYAYNDMASKIKSSVKGSTLRGQKVNFSDIVSIQDAARYIRDTLIIQDKKVLEEQRKEVQELMGIDASEMTPEQLKSILEGDAKVTKYNESIVRTVAEKAFEAYSAVIDEILKTGYDAFYTGEKVELSKNQKTLIKKFMDMDLSVLTPKEALQAVDALANFIQNQSTAKMETIVSDYTGRLNAQTLASSKIKAQPLMKYKSKGFGKFLAEQTTTLPILFEKMFKGFNRSGKVMDMMGVTKLINGKSLAQNQSNMIVNDYVKQFFNKTANGEAFNTDYNNVERGMASFMMRNVIGTEEQMQAEFNRRKNLLEESIEVLSKGNDLEKQKAELYKKAYGKILMDSKTIQDIKNKTDKTNLEAIDFWTNEWADKYQELSDVSENVYNKILDKDINYTPDRFAKISSDTGEVDLANDESAFHNNNGTVYKKETGVLMTATKPDSLPKNKKNGKATSYIELSFDKNNSNAMYDALVDIKTASAIRQIEAFENSEYFEQIVPTADDAKILKDRVQLYVRNIRNKSPYSDDQFSKAVRSLNRLAAFGVGQALSGFGQPIKQMVPVLTNTLINAGSIDIMSGFDAAKQKFMSESGYGIANRGVESQAQIESLNKLIDSAPTGNFDKTIKAIEKINQKYLEFFLVNPDVFIARASWMSYYEKSLKEQGIDPKGVDYNTHELNEEAANYAQRMVDRQQNISDVDLSGKLFASKESANQVLVKMLMPFASFRMNQSARLGADLATLADKTASAEDKTIAKKSLAGFGVELATFKMISAGIAITLGTLTKALMGQDEDEEEKDKRINNVIKGQWTGTITDIISPLPVVDKPIQAAVESVSTLLEEGTGLPVSTFGVSKSDWTSNLGTFGISAQRASELYDMSKLAATGEYTDDFNKKHTISEESQSQIAKLLPFAMLSNMGLAPSEVNTVVKNAVKYAKKNTKSPEEKQQAKENKEERESTKQEKINALELIIEESNDEAIIKQAREKIDEVDADSEEKKAIKEENAKEKQAKKKLLVDPDTGEEYDTESDLKRYNKDLWEQNFGEGSDWYESHKEEKEVENLLRKKVREIKDEEMNYTGRNSDGSVKRFGASGTKKAQRFGSSSRGKVKRFGS